MHRITLFWLCAMMGCTSTTVSPSTPRKNAELRVTTFNVRYGTAPDGPNHWDLRKAGLIKAVQNADPDLLGTQETIALQRDFILAELPQYAAVSAGRDDGKEAGEMTAVFYRRGRFDLLDSGHFWLSATPDKPGVRGWDADFPRMATWLKLRDRKSPNAKPILLINTHLDHVGKQARLESAKLIRRRAAEMGKGCSIVIIGDFNCGQDDAPYSVFSETPAGAAPLGDVYRVANPKRERNEGTFHAFNVDRTEGDRIDWIFAKDDFAVASAAIDRNLYDGHLPSDHFPVNAVLRRK